MIIVQYFTWTKSRWRKKNYAKSRTKLER